MIYFIKSGLFALWFKYHFGHDKDRVFSLDPFRHVSMYDILCESHDPSLPIAWRCLVGHYAIMVLIFGFV